MSPSRVDIKPRVVVLGTPKFIGDDYLAEFSKEFDYAVLDAANRKETQEKLPAMIAEHGPIDAFIVRMGTPPYEPFDADLLSSLVPGCRIIASASAGFNEFDVEWMTSRGIWFCNTVDAVAEATADMACFLTLAVVRDTYRAERGARGGSWKAGVAPSRDPSGMTLGIVGMGSIGKYLARKAAAFNMRIKYHNRRRLPPAEEARLGAEYCASLHELLGASDVVSLNCPLNDQTTGLMSTAEFAAMREGAFLVNTARGAVVDEAALIEALESGKVARAGLDVFCNEPDINEYFKMSDKVICQPHMGGLTESAFRKAERECFENVRALFKTGRPVAPVNEVAKVAVKETSG
ncbi:putative 2-hydroxyacid dehydrogenase [Phialemonium atrogriseum]|uniref:2-hydroxyacid dehydrogenase n=1 Tax=Phialemonium atrogriseum TaxID=1093897 RepID=A0AAJ0FEL8_9PEZI|nr:putative 2-hydroxyacid dehydrogenase [Phialemonium atrogriseum]KAK1764502.1 putative 2-hydroxyacid dehydrogenase [Phialemonium atrogriseum]